MTAQKFLPLLILAGVLLTACNLPTSQPPTLSPSATAETSATGSPNTATVPPDSIPTPTATQADTATLQPSQTPAPTVTATPTTAPTNTPAPSNTPSPSPVPTYVTLRGQVTVEQAVCHYGPGKPYLYKYGVYQGSNLEIIARVELGTYVEVQAIGGNNPCWLNPDYLNIKGDVQNLRPIPADQVKLPPSPYYGALTGVSAARSGSEVTVSWNALVLKAGDSSEQTPYVVEAWVCQGGKIVFTPVGSYQTSVKIVDEPGCATASRGRVTAAEKHGYTRPVDLNWPQP